MCLIIVAHRVSARFPLVIAANRDEDHLRPSRAAHAWDDAPNVIGGRDLLAGGSWLAIRRNGRWAAVTNLRGSAKTPDSRSRGALVAGFVLGDAAPIDYTSAIARDADAYAGFHLLAGVAGESLAYFATGMDAASELPPGIHGVSNGPPEAQWIKVERGVAAMREALSGGGTGALACQLIDFLGTPTPGEPIENSAFVIGERYGTRSSTAIVAGRDGIRFIEQNWRPAHSLPSPTLPISTSSLRSELAEFFVSSLSRA
jgi:uncharacterized protein with NRDE domain